MNVQPQEMHQGPALWQCKVKYHLRPEDPIWGSLGCPTSDPTPAHCLRRPVETDPRAGSPATHTGDQMDFQTPGFSWAQH